MLGQLQSAFELTNRARREKIVAANLFASDSDWSIASKRAVADSSRSSGCRVEGRTEVNRSRSDGYRLPSGSDCSMVVPQLILVHQSFSDDDDSPLSDDIPPRRLLYLVPIAEAAVERFSPFLFLHPSHPSRSFPIFSDPPPSPPPPPLPPPPPPPPPRQANMFLM